MVLAPQSPSAKHSVTLLVMVNAGAMPEPLTTTLPCTTICTARGPRPGVPLPPHVEARPEVTRQVSMESKPEPGGGRYDGAPPDTEHTPAVPQSAFTHTPIG